MKLTLCKAGVRVVGVAGLMAAAAACLAGYQRLETATNSVPTKESTFNFERRGNLIVIGEQSALRSRLVFDAARPTNTQTRLAVPAVVEADPQRFANIFPPLSGRLAKLHVQLGDSVTNGQLLASLDSPDFFSAQNDYVKARSAEQLTSRALQRQRELSEHKIAAQKDIEQAQSDYESARSDLENATARLAAYGFNPCTEKLGQPLRVFAPIPGQVVDMASAHGQFRNDVTAPLMTVADLSTVWLTASVAEKDLRFLSKGQKISASLAAYPGEEFLGEVLFVGDLIDSDLRTAKVRVAFPNSDGRLKPGMYATVNFFGYPKTQITVPATAVVQMGQSSFVFKQVKPWTLQPQEVQLGAQDGDRVTILSGLEAGSLILAKEGVLFQ